MGNSLNTILLADSLWLFCLGSSRLLWSFRSHEGSNRQFSVLESSIVAPGAGWEPFSDNVRGGRASSH